MSVSAKRYHHDASVLAEVRQSLGEERFALALAHFRALLKTMCDAVRPGSDADVHTVAHQLAGAAGMLGFSELSRLSRRLMKATQDGEEFGQESSDLLTAIDKVVRQLDLMAD